MTAALGLDLGASGIRAWHERLVEPEQITAAAAEDDRHHQAEELASEVSKSLKESFENVCLGLSGFSSLNVDHQKLASKLIELFDAKHVIITSDMVTPHYASFGENDGIVAAIGTGTLFFGVGSDSLARLDGLGATVGDYGSAHWIGREGLRRSSRSKELGSPNQLLTTLEQALGSYAQWPKKIASGELRTFEIAGLSKYVTQAAENSDPVALEIIQDAVAFITESIVALSEKLGVFNISLAGGVLKSELILKNLMLSLEKHNLNTSFGSASSVVGSLQLAKAFDSPRIRFLESEKQLFRLGV